MSDLLNNYKRLGMAVENCYKRRGYRFLIIAFKNSDQQLIIECDRIQPNIKAINKSTNIVISWHKSQFKTINPKLNKDILKKEEKDIDFFVIKTKRTPIYAPSGQYTKGKRFKHYKTLEKFLAKC